MPESSIASSREWASSTLLDHAKTWVVVQVVLPIALFKKELKNVNQLWADSTIVKYLS